MRGCITFLLWPIILAIRLAKFALNGVLRLITIALGLMAIGLGIVVSFTGIGIVIGIPLILTGMVLIVRGIF